MTAMLRMPILAALLLALPCAAVGQSVSVLRVKVVLVDAEDKPTPVGRHALLVSDVPPSAPPRRILTGPDGTVDVRLRPGMYSVESDRPVRLDGRAYQWMQMVDVAAGRETVLELTAANAEVEEAGPLPAPIETPQDTSESAVLTRWRRSVVALWTPTARALGFVVDAQGLVMTNQRVVGDAPSVEVQFSPTVKVAGRVLAADAPRDVAVLWVDSTITATVQPVPLACQDTAGTTLAGDEDVFTLDGPLRGGAGSASGRVLSVEPGTTLADFRPEPRTTGGPVFDTDGRLVGLTSWLGGTDERPGRELRVVGVDAACEVLRSAEITMKSTEPPSSVRLPVEPAQPLPVEALRESARKRGVTGPHRMSSSDFDIALITPPQVYAAQQRWGAAGRGASIDDITPAGEVHQRQRLLTDFGPWSDYVAEVPPVLLVRVTPRLVEGFWKMVARGAAYTQGVSLPPFKSFKPGFSRMRALCGDAEVAPIHAFTIERRISEDDAIREGLLVFDADALGPACGKVRLVLYSETQPAKGETRDVDPALVQQVWQDFAPYRAQRAEPEN